MGYIVSTGNEMASPRQRRNGWPDVPRTCTACCPKKVRPCAQYSRAQSRGSGMRRGGAPGAAETWSAPATARGCVRHCAGPHTPSDIADKARQLGAPACRCALAGRTTHPRRMPCLPAPPGCPEIGPQWMPRRLPHTHSPRPAKAMRPHAGAVWRREATHHALLRHDEELGLVRKPERLVCPQPAAALGLGAAPRLSY